jgi:hypothetical protein
MTIDELKAQLGDRFGSLIYTRSKKNPYRAQSKDGLNIAYGPSKEAALQSLIDAIDQRAQCGQ